MAHFIYTRSKQVHKKDANGAAIPLKDEQGNEIKGQFETEEVIMVDSFNLDKVIRTHMINEEHVIVLLDDGHEDTQEVPTREKNKIVNKKQRVWIQSEISVKGQEVKELYEALKNVK